MYYVVPSVGADAGKIYLVVRILIVSLVGRNVDIYQLHVVQPWQQVLGNTACRYSVHFTGTVHTVHAGTVSAAIEKSLDVSFELAMPQKGIFVSFLVECVSNVRSKSAKCESPV